MENTRYHQIIKLINEEIDEVVAEDFEASGYEKMENYRDELIATYISHLKEELQSDNA